jgi:hypothetical protein
LSKPHPSEACRFQASFEDGEKDNAFSMVAYKAGQVIEHWYWEKLAFELSSMSMRKEKIPALVDHETDHVCGVITAFSKNGQAEFKGHFVDNENADYVKSLRELGQECSLRFDADKAIVEQVPAGMSIVVDGFTIKGPVAVIKQCEIMEVSFTVFGAVPDTKTSFSTSQLQEKKMAETPTTPADVRASVEKELKAKFSKFTEISGDKNFALECFSQDMSIEAFSEKLIGKLKTEVSAFQIKVSELEGQLAQAQSEIAEFKKAPVAATFTATENCADAPKNYMEAVSQFKAKGKNIEESLQLAAKAFPQLYLAHSGRSK